MSYYRTADPIADMERHQMRPKVIKGQCEMCNTIIYQPTDIVYYNIPGYGLICEGCKYDWLSQFEKEY